MNPPRKEDEPDRKVVVTNPDPSFAAQKALEVAIESLKDTMDRRFQGVEQRFLDVAQATVLAREEMKDKLYALQETLTNAATALAAANKDLVSQLAQANQVALNAALQTQEKSANKSEGAINDIIKQSQASFEAAVKVVNEKIDRLTSRMDTGVDWRGGVDANRMDYRADRRESTQAAVDHRMYIIAAIGAALAIAGFFGLGLHR